MQEPYNQSSLYEQFNIHFKASFQIKKGDKLLLAISGGLDSMVLLHLISQLGLDFELAHCNFQLRGSESESDMGFVQEASEIYGVHAHIKSFDTQAYANTHKGSIQMAARDLRYQFFGELMQEHSFRYLVTAHHADDNLETFLINLSRGSGLDGLCGIPEKNGNIIRPLLPFVRHEIKAYAIENNIRWRDDSSNQEKKYLRNKIRHDLVPLLKELNPSFMDTFSNSLMHLKGSKMIIDDTMDQLRNSIIDQTVNDDTEVIRFKVSELSTIADNTAYLYQLFYPYGFHQFDDIKSLIAGQSGKQVLSKSHRLLKNREHLLLTRVSDQPKNDSSIIIENIDDSYTFNEHVLTLESLDAKKFANPLEEDQGHHIAYFDKEALEFPLSVRKWKKGDYFYPLGMTGKKKLSKFFKDEKYSLLEKENIWLLCSANHIIWVIGKRMDDRYKISNKTKNILKASFTT